MTQNKKMSFPNASVGNPELRNSRPESVPKVRGYRKNILSQNQSILTLPITKIFIPACLW
jgi:hypothetical protein